jgi:hypothetical protein
MCCQCAGATTVVAGAPAAHGRLNGAVSRAAGVAGACAGHVPAPLFTSPCGGRSGGGGGHEPSAAALVAFVAANTARGSARSVTQVRG